MQELRREFHEALSGALQVPDYFSATPSGVQAAEGEAMIHRDRWYNFADGAFFLSWAIWAILVLVTFWWAYA